MLSGTRRCFRFVKRSVVNLNNVKAIRVLLAKRVQESLVTVAIDVRKL